MISAQLKDLPEPEYTYDIAIPEVEKEEEDVDVANNVLLSKPQDAAEVLAELEHQRSEERRLQLARRSAVIKRSLPRPSDCSFKHLKSQSIGASNASVSNNATSVSSMINEEMMRLMAWDAYEHPDAATTAGRAQQFDIPRIEDDLMTKARELIAREVTAIESLSAYGGPCPADTFNTVWEDVHRSVVCAPITEKKRKHSETGTMRCDFLLSSSTSKTEVFYLVSSLF